MQYATIPRTDLRVSRLCLGMMSFGDTRWAKWVRGPAEGSAMVARALDAGINFFDTADAYSFGESERILGNAIKQHTTRDKVVIATKVGLGFGLDVHGLTRANIFAAIDKSLERLGTDYIDLYQMHGWDDAVDIDETMGALDDLVKAGKVRYIGASNFYAWQLAVANLQARAQRRAEHVCMQLQYNLAYREEEREMLPFCARENIGVIVFSPLGRGFLAGIRRAAAGTSENLRSTTDTKGQRAYGQSDEPILDALEKIAERRGVPPSRVAVAWILSKPSITSVLQGPTEPAHLDNSIAAVDLSLNAGEIEELEAPYRPRASEMTDIFGLPF